MLEPKVMIMEFLSLVFLVVGAGLAGAYLQLVGQGGSEIAATFLDVVKVGFGAILALAYAARGVTPATKP